jgi:hypothetical protein
MRRLLAYAVAVTAVLTVAACAAVPVTRTSGPSFTLKWSTDFGSSVPVGAFSGCSATTFQCSGLAKVSAPVYRNFGAYPSGWPDTCAGKNADVCAPGAEGGYYEPQSTVWISGGDMYIKETTDADGVGSMAAIVPLQALNMTYGEFTETFRVTEATPGYKSAHLIVANTDVPGYYESDYPEGDWDSVFWAHQHNASAGNADSYEGTTFSAWHTTTIEWYPGHMVFILDGKVIGTSVDNVQSSPGIWVWQNENSTDGENAPVNSSAEMEVSYAAVYSYTG